MNSAIRRRRIGIDHAHPYSAAQTADGLSPVPFARDFDKFRNVCVEVRIHSPTIQVRKTSILLTSAITSESKRERKGRGRVPGPCHSASYCRHAAQLASAGTPKLERSRFFRQGIEQATLKCKR